MNFHKIRYYVEMMLHKLNLFRIMEFFQREKYSDIVVRVDDFPHWVKNFGEFKKFDNILKKHKIPYILGIIPLVSQNPTDTTNNSFRKLTWEEQDYIRNRIRGGGIIPAMHGFTHKTSFTKPYSEFKGISSEEVERKIKEGLNLFEEYKIKPSIFMPPNNEFDNVSLNIIKKYFKVITGGPESIKHFGRIKKMKDIKYLPSYFPYYLHPKKKFPKISKDGCITLHWAWFTLSQIEEIAKKLNKHNILKIE